MHGSIWEHGYQVAECTSLPERIAHMDNTRLGCYNWYCLIVRPINDHCVEYGSLPCLTNNENMEKEARISTQRHKTFKSCIMFVDLQECHKLYLSNRTIFPITVPANWIKMPAEIKIGTARPISNVASLSGFGKRAGLRVASSKPSK